LSPGRRPENEEWEKVGVAYSIWANKWIFAVILIILMIWDHFSGERLETTINTIALIIVFWALLSLFLTKIAPSVICPCGRRVFLGERKCSRCERIIPSHIR
jgi:hypothetical protein